jgi:hypothetical protein
MCGKAPPSSAGVSFYVVIAMQPRYAGEARQAEAKRNILGDNARRLFISSR